MYYIDKLKEQIETFAASLEKGGMGLLVASLRGHPMWLISEIEPEVALMERFAAVCDKLGIDPDNLAELETFTTDKQYRSDLSDLKDAIAKAAGTVRDDTREQEYQNACTMLEAAGFKPDPENDDILTRKPNQDDGQIEVVQIETKRKHTDFWYEFIYERDGDGILTGRSGEFGKLLAAVGISQNVEASK